MADSKEEIDLFDDLNSEVSSILVDDFDDIQEGDADNLNYDEADNFSVEEKTKNKEQVASTLPPPQKKEGKKRTIPLILLLLVFGVLIFFFQDRFEDLDNLIKLDDEPDVGIIDEPIIPILVEEPTLEPEIPSPDKAILITEQIPEKPEEKKVWHVQVALCKFESCVEKVTNRLQEMGFAISKASHRRSFPLIHLLSKDRYNTVKSEEILSVLKNDSQDVFFPTRIPYKKNYRISLGYFPTLENAKIVREYVEKRIFRGNVLFSMNKVYRSSNSIKVLAGPYLNIDEARVAMQDLRDFSEFSDAFLVKSNS